MKKLLSTAIATALTATGLLATSATLNNAAAEVAFNAGVMSQYIFRGYTQRDSASLMGGADYTHKSGAYLGTWFAQVGTESGANNGPFLNNSSTSNGYEIDVYGGYKTSIGDLGLGLGFTSYQYTNKVDSNGTGFDTSYNELNLSASYSIFTATINPGVHEGSKGWSTKDQNYLFSSIKAEYEGFYGLVGHWDWDYKPTAGKPMHDGTYLQAGYKTSLGGIDLEAAIVNSDKYLNSLGAHAYKDDDTRMFFSASKSF
jgi:uncharacterized protein (TIGR02001 family)